MISFYIKVNPDSPDQFTIEVNDGDLLQIGRRPAPDGVKKLVLPDSGISGLHAEIRCEGNRWTLRDLNSTNGTTINDRVCVSQSEYSLQLGDLIRIAGAHSLLIHHPTFSGPARTSEPVDQFQVHLGLTALPVQELSDFEETSDLEDGATEESVGAESAAERSLQEEEKGL